MTEQAGTIYRDDEQVRMYWDIWITLQALYGAAIPKDFDVFVQWLDNLMENRQ